MPRASSGTRNLRLETSTRSSCRGFSYGDYLRCGAIARFSPVMQAVKQFADNGGLVLGICNGFQVLTEAGCCPARSSATAICSSNDRTRHHPELVAKHNLTPEEYAHAVEILGRTPSYTELGIFSVMWSEHCSYKNTARCSRPSPPSRRRSSSARARKTPASLTSATASPSRSRSSRTIIRARSSRFRARPPASAASCATFSRWARGRFAR
jgi:hypothetical protein